MNRQTPEKTRWAREDRLPSLAELAWLQSAEGRAACLAMTTDEPADSPAAIERWRTRLPAAQVSAAWAQVLLRRAAAGKFSRAAEMLLDRVGLEQSTDEWVATYKAGRFAGLGRIADLCCGIGGDALALAAQGEVVAVDRMALRVSMAQHNAAVYGRAVMPRVADVTHELPAADVAHVDPDRRATGRRQHDAEAASPGLTTLERIVQYYPRAAIKLSPGAEFDELPFEAEIELISHHGECKQAVAWTGDLAQAHRRATVLFRPNGGKPGAPQASPPLTKGGPGGDSEGPSASHAAVHSAPFAVAQISAAPGELLEWPLDRPPEPENYLYEPDPAVIRANLVGVLAYKLGLAPVDPLIAWLVGDAPISNPLVHTFRILDVRPWSAKPARTWLARHDIGPLEIKTRGFAARPEQILKQLRPAGQRPGVLFLTRLSERPIAILAERLPGIS